MTTVRASELSTMGFCEHLIHLQHTERLYYSNNRKPERLITGAAAHKLLDERFLSQTNRKMSMRKMLFSKRRCRTRPDASGIMLSATLKDIYLVGKIDELVSDITGIYVIDDKPHYYAFEGLRNQVRVYCLLIEENFKKEIGHKPLYSMLRNTGNQEVFWREQFDSKVKQKLIKTLERVRDIKEGKIKAKKSDNERKCRKCFQRKACGLS